MPAEPHPALGGLHDVLLVEQVDRVAQRGPRDLGHQVGEQKALDVRALAVRVDEVAAAAVVEVERVDAVAVHLTVALVDQPAAFCTQELEIARGQDAVEDEEAVVGEAARVLGRMRAFAVAILLSLSVTSAAFRTTTGMSSRQRASSYRFLR